MKKLAIALAFVLLLAAGAPAQTITPTGVKQGDLVALLQNIVDALGSTVGSTYLTAGTAIAIAAGAISGTNITASGIFSSASGTEGAPGITFTGDTDTGIYRISADSFALVEGGSEAVILNSSGNITIGGSNLAATGERLHVNGDQEISDSSPILRITDTDDKSSEATLQSYINFKDEDAQDVFLIGDVAGGDNTLDIINYCSGSGIDMKVTQTGGSAATAFIVNKTGEVTVGDTDVITGGEAGLAVHTDHVGGLMIPVNANGTQPPTPPAGYATLFCETVGGKNSIQFIFEDGSTAEACVQP